ncbi:hypothetical protein SHIRM173S_03336 [Streptomyces hirsutus]
MNRSEVSGGLGPVPERFSGTAFSFRGPITGLICTLKWLARVFAVEYSVIWRCRGSHVWAYSSILCCPSSRCASATEGAVFFRSAYSSVSRSTAAS